MSGGPAHGTVTTTFDTVRAFKGPIAGSRRIPSDSVKTEGVGFEPTEAFTSPVFKTKL
jgi:hypothetical protein